MINWPEMLRRVRDWADGFGPELPPQSCQCSLGPRSYDSFAPFGVWGAPPGDFRAFRGLPGLARRLLCHANRIARGRLVGKGGGMAPL